MPKLDEFLKNPDKYPDPTDTVNLSVTTMRNPFAPKTYKLQLHGYHGAKEEWIDIPKDHDWYKNNLGGQYSGLTAEAAQQLVDKFHELTGETDPHLKMKYVPEEDIPVDDRRYKLQVKNPSMDWTDVSVYDAENNNWYTQHLDTNKFDDLTLEEANNLLYKYNNHGGHSSEYQMQMIRTS